MATADSVTSRISQLHQEIDAILDTQHGSPDVSSYGAALCKALGALRLAQSFVGSHGSFMEHKMLETCQEYRRLCYEPLMQLLEKEDKEDKENGPAPSPRNMTRRQGVIFNVDAGEHIADAIQALTLQDYLDQQVSGEEPAPPLVSKTNDGPEKKAPVSDVVDDVAQSRSRSRSGTLQRQHAVRKRDGRGRIAEEPEVVPPLRTKGGMRFDGWMNTL
ncbi:hypothetical protein F5Y15DRAFT_356053 [Xylariaceae sp. FL0016]|nr:hypothetical protein F5Y15DRAFT_356053 [Xylariaceae sp. FL0016]